MAQIIITVAGSTWVLHGDGGPATSAPLGYVPGVAVDASGNVFASDSGNNIVVKISPAGIGTVVAGNGTAGFSGDGGPATSASLCFPWDVAVDGTGNLYIADKGNQRIRMVTPAGAISTVAGGGSTGGDGGPATNAWLMDPSAVSVDGSGNLYIADSYGGFIRKVAPTGIISTVAGIRTLGYSGDGGPATRAELNYPEGVAVDGAGNLYIADSRNQRIRKVTAAGTISTVAGYGGQWFYGDGGPATSASLNFPSGVAVDGAGNLYIADTSNSRIRKVTTAGIISTVAGNGNCCFSGDGGLATAATVYFPQGVAVDGAGNLYIADSNNRRIRKVAATGTISTVAGNGNFEFSGDAGPATSASLNLPYGVAVDGASNLYIADSGNQRIRLVSPTGTISTIAGNGIAGFSGDGGLSTSASLRYPAGTAVDGAGNLYIVDDTRIRKVAPAGTISTVAGDGTYGFSGDWGPATAAALDGPWGVAVDNAGDLYIADTFNQRIRMVTPSGTISTVAGGGTCCSPSGDGGPATSAWFFNPHGVAVDGAGNLYIVDSEFQTIRKVTSGGIISTVVGTSGAQGFGGDGGPATFARLFYPTGIATDGAGNLYIADTDNQRIRKVTPAGTINTVAGNGIQGFSGDGGPATSASLSLPGGVAADGAGNIYIADTGNNRIRMVFTPATTYLVGDAYPPSWIAGDFNGDGTTFDVGEFGDGVLNTLDLIAALRAMTNVPGFRPPECSDQFDAMDSYPPDNGVIRGGDGQLNNFDLIMTLRRVTSVETTRPSRASRGFSPCSAASTAVAGRGFSRAESQLTLMLGDEETGRGPLYLRAGSNISLAGFSIGLGTKAGGKLSFEAARPASLTDQAGPETLAVAWLGRFALPANTPLLLGYLRADHTSLAALRVHGAVATAADGHDLPVALPSNAK